jgi:hypothetical protein
MQSVAESGQIALQRFWHRAGWTGGGELERHCRWWVNQGELRAFDLSRQSDRGLGRHQTL